MRLRRIVPFNVSGRLRRAHSIVLSLWAAVVTASSLGAAQAPVAAVQLTFVDVGQGDAVIVRSPEGRVAIVDAGSADPVRRWLRRISADTIDLVIASHAHLDHIGGLAELIASENVAAFMDNGIPHTTSAYLQLMDVLVERASIEYLTSAAQTIGFGSASLRVLPPPGRGDQNNNSVGILVEFGEFRAMLTGDSEVEELNHFLSLGVPKVTLLKAAHHGSRNGITPRWLAQTKPDVVVISCGRNNGYGHPDPWALRYYETAAKEVYRTDVHGSVTVTGFADGSYTITLGDRSP